MFTILHVDNSSFFSRVLAEIFKKKGYVYIAAKDIASAFTVLEQKNVNLIVTAIEVKGGGGEKLIDSLSKSPYSTIPIIVITSYDSIEIRTKLFSRGVIDFIQKDRDFGERLLSYINKLTEENTIINRIKTMRIAVLDDSKLELNIISNILSLNGIQKIDFYTDPINLLESKKEYDIYFIDLVLPHISGEQVILNIRENNKESVIIAVSGIDNYKVISNILLTGADDYMLKPFNASIFMARLIANVRSFILLTEIEKKNHELKLITMTDSLTKLYNHNYMYRRLEAEIEEAHDNARKIFSIALFSIDHFIAINDTHGHQVGDKVIIKITEVIKESLSELDILGRYSGVQFMLIMPETSLEEAYQLAEKIRTKVNTVRFKNKHLSLSGAVVEYENEAVMDILKKLDSLLFNAKSHGKNRIEKEFRWEI